MLKQLEEAAHENGPAAMQPWATPEVLQVDVVPPPPPIAPAGHCPELTHPASVAKHCVAAAQENAFIALQPMEMPVVLHDEAVVVPPPPPMPPPAGH